jgi:hypothetical protein
MFYYCLCLHNSWYRYNIRFFTFTTCFDLMWPSSGTFRFTITYFFYCYSPYSLQCLQIGSELYVSFYVMPCVAERIKYLMFQTLKYKILDF